MPLIIATLVLAGVVGLFAPRRIALGVVGVASAATLFSFVWAITDGQGNDPWWLILLAVAGCSLAFVVAITLQRVRSRRRAPAGSGSEAR